MTTFENQKNLPLAGDILDDLSIIFREMYSKVMTIIFFKKYRYCVSNHSDMGGLVLVGTYHTFVDDEFSEKCLCIVSIIYRRFDVTVVVVVVADGVFQRL